MASFFKFLLSNPKTTSYNVHSNCKNVWTKPISQGMEFSVEIRKLASVKVFKLSLYRNAIEKQSQLDHFLK